MRVLKILFRDWNRSETVLRTPYGICILLGGISVLHGVAILHRSLCPQWECPSSMGTFVLTQNLRSLWESPSSELEVRSMFFSHRETLQLIAPRAVQVDVELVHQIHHFLHLYRFVSKSGVQVQARILRILPAFPPPWTSAILPNLRFLFSQATPNEQ